jgi:membrane-anchored glycerophosphoryl diester phosphodiesterase (GDPDase)
MQPTCRPAFPSYVVIMQTLAHHPDSLGRKSILLLLLLAYVLTGLLVLQQQRTIESQSLLIRDLFHDSLELTQIKIRKNISRAHTPASTRPNQ